MFTIKEWARSTLQWLLPDQQENHLIGILLGDDNGLALKFEEQFLTAGLTHIIAIWGLNDMMHSGPERQ